MQRGNSFSKMRRGSGRASDFPGLCGLGRTSERSNDPCPPALVPDLMLACLRTLVRPPLAHSLQPLFHFPRPTKVLSVLGSLVSLFWAPPPLQATAVVVLASLTNSIPSRKTRGTSFAFTTCCFASECTCVRSSDACILCVYSVYFLQRPYSTANLRAKNPQTENLWVSHSGKFPNDLGAPPLEIKNLLESDPLKSRFLVTVCSPPRLYLIWWLGL